MNSVISVGCGMMVVAKIIIEAQNVDQNHSAKV
jgi:hypothetical protein